MKPTIPAVHSDPDIRGGEPVFVGTRVPYRAMLDYLEAGDSLHRFLEHFPSVTHELAIGGLRQAEDALRAPETDSPARSPIPGRSTESTVKARRLHYRSPLTVRNGGDTPITLIVEPWASEFEIPIGGECTVVFTHPDRPPVPEVWSSDGTMVVCPREGESLYEVWSQGKLIG